MAKPLADLLQAEIKNLRPHEIKVFRAELVRTLPGYIHELARQARQPARPEKASPKPGGRVPLR